MEQLYAVIIVLVVLVILVYSWQQYKMSHKGHMCPVYVDEDSHADMADGDVEYESFHFIPPAPNSKMFNKHCIRVNQEDIISSNSHIEDEAGLPPRRRLILKK